ncbi:MAG: XRE family transcriptional regulator, partial [Paracoccaceae bacterium]
AALARDQSPVANRITRFVAEALENDVSTILSVARTQGYIEIDDVPPYHRQLLQLDSPIR